MHNDLFLLKYLPLDNEDSISKLLIDNAIDKLFFCDSIKNVILSKIKDENLKSYFKEHFETFAKCSLKSKVSYTYRKPKIESVKSMDKKTEVESVVSKDKKTEVESVVSTDKKTENESVILREKENESVKIKDSRPKSELLQTSKKKSKKAKAKQSSKYFRSVYHVWPEDKSIFASALPDYRLDRKPFSDKQAFITYVPFGGKRR